MTTQDWYRGLVEVVEVEFQALQEHDKAAAQLRSYATGKIWDR